MEWVTCGYQHAEEKKNLTMAKVGWLPSLEDVWELVVLAELPLRQGAPLPRAQVVLLRVPLLRVLLTGKMGEETGRSLRINQAWDLSIE